MTRSVFLISVVLTQMPGYPGTAPTYFQAVECLALLTLMATDAGRYAGLDFIPWAWWHRRPRRVALAGQTGGRPKTGLALVQLSTKLESTNK